MKTAIADIIKSTSFRVLKARRDKSFYRVLGLRRSGNHALMGWLYGQMQGCTLVLDNMQQHKPVYTPNKKLIFKGLTKVQLMVSHEDRVVDEFFTNYSSDHFGHSKQKFSLLVLRDPYNCLASWCAWQDELGERFRNDQEFRTHTVDLWKQYARKYLEWESNSAHPNDESIVQLVVNYNRWTVDKEYRKLLAENVGLKFSDKGREKISINGHGSSFDAQRLDGQASQLKVLERWKSFRNDSFYTSLFDSEIHNLASQIFPDLKVEF